MNRPNDPIFDCLEQFFSGARIQGWYKADLGPILDLPQEVWIMSVYDTNRLTFGRRNEKYAVVADNTFFGSATYNLVLPRLAEMIAPGRFDTLDVLTGNFKFYCALAEIRKRPSGDGRAILLEYLFEYDQLNREVLQTVREHKYKLPLQQQIASFATHLVVLHEIGHFAYRTSFRMQEARDHVQSWIKNQCTTVPNQSIFMEEVSCDLFAAINTVDEMVRAGLPAKAAMELCIWLTLSMHLLHLLTEVNESLYDAKEPLKMNFSDHMLVRRYHCMQAVLRDIPNSDLPNGENSPLNFSFHSDEEMLFEAMTKASTWQVRDQGVRRMSKLVVDAFDSEGLIHILKNTQQFWSASESDPAVKL